MCTLYIILALIGVVFIIIILAILIMAIFENFITFLILNFAIILLLYYFEENKLLPNKNCNYKITKEVK